MLEIGEGIWGTNVYGEKLDPIDRILSVASGAGSIGANFGLAGIKPRQEMVTIYRAVNPEELKSIQNTGTFINPNGLEGKYFTTRSDAASDYARQAVKAFGDEPYTIIQTQVPRSVLNQPGISATVDGGIPAYVIPNKNLQEMTPEILNYSTLP